MQVPNKIDSFSLEQILINSDHKFNIDSKKQQGFTLSNNDIRIEYFHFGPISLVIDFLTNPHLRFESGINPIIKSSSEIYLETIYFLSSNPNNENSNSHILAQTSSVEGLKPKDVDNNINFYDIIKNLENLAKENSKDTFFEPKKKWFENANYLIFNLLIQSNFYQVHNTWFREFKFPKMNLINKSKYCLGLSYKFK